MPLLDELKAAEDIRQLKARYFRFLDTKDWNGMRTVFCRDAIFDLRAAAVADPNDGSAIAQATAHFVYEGVDKIVDHLKESTAPVTTVHHGHCHEVTIDSATEAHGIIAMVDIINNTASGEQVLEGYGHYHETYRREDSNWRIWRSRLSRLKVVRGPGFRLE